MEIKVRDKKGHKPSYFTNVLTFLVPSSFLPRFSLQYIKKLTPNSWSILPGFVPGMSVPGTFYVNSRLEQLMLSELRQSCDGTGVGGFIPAVTQIANVAALPGIVKSSIAMPDVHSGYGFSIGNVAAFDMNDKDAIVSPGGVGFDINCGVRLLRTNLFEGDIKDVKEQVSERERESQ